MTENIEIRPFRIDIPQADLEDLRDRLDRVRWPGEISGQGWTRGVPVDYLRQLVAYWADGYSWRKQEARLNNFPQFIADIDGQPLHFAHVRSDDPNALPLLLTHDWPGSFVVFAEVIEELSKDFHVIAPTSPGSGSPARCPTSRCPARHQR